MRAQKARESETVKLNLDPSLQARQKNIQYTTSFNLPPGKYHLKFVVRENQTGLMSSFEAEITLPEMKKAALKMSSIVLASMRQPSRKTSPLIRNGPEYVPNISHVFLLGSAPLPALRNLLAGARKARGWRAQRKQAGHRRAQQPETDPRFDEGV